MVVNARAVACLFVILNALGWAAYFLADETPAAVYVRLAYAAAITAGAAAVVAAVVYLTRR